MIDRIKKFFGSGVPQKCLWPFKVLTGLISHHFLQKFISLITAFLMWFFVMESQDPTIEGSYDVPVTISNAPADLTANCEEKIINIMEKKQYMIIH